MTDVDGDVEGWSIDGAAAAGEKSSKRTDGSNVLQRVVMHRGGW